MKRGTAILAVGLAGASLVGGCSGGDKAPGPDQRSRLAADRAAIAARDACMGIISVETGTDRRVTILLNIGKTAAGQAIAKLYEHDATITWTPPSVAVWELTSGQDGQTRLGRGLRADNFKNTSTAVITTGADAAPGQRLAVFWSARQRLWTQKGSHTTRQLPAATAARSLRPLRSRVVCHGKLTPPPPHRLTSPMSTPANLKRKTLRTTRSRANAHSCIIC